MTKRILIVIGIIFLLACSGRLFYLGYANNRSQPPVDKVLKIACVRKYVPEGMMYTLPPCQPERDLGWVENGVTLHLFATTTEQEKNLAIKHSSYIGNLILQHDEAHK